MNLDLVVLNVAAYGSLAAGLMQTRRQRSSGEAEISGAFPLLARSLRKALPELPAGFTWRQGISAAKGLELKLRWDEIDKAVAEYEAYRYGGRPAPEPSQPEVMRLVEALKRRHQ
jgi:hypothetical protein